MKLWNRLPMEAVRAAFLEFFSWPGSSVTHDTGTTDPASYLHIREKHQKVDEHSSFLNKTYLLTQKYSCYTAEINDF